METEGLGAMKRKWLWIALTVFSVGIFFIAAYDFIARFKLQRTLELENKADSIGLWYTIYCSLGYEQAIVLIVLIIILVARLFIRKKR
jgi:hypothetical protein